MKISQEEIDAAITVVAQCQWHHVPTIKTDIVKILEAAITVRKARKAAKRERQRKEKDKQVGESVKPADFNSQQVNTFVNPFEALKPSNVERAKNFLRSSQLNAVMSTPSKAPEWDGTFGVGEWMTQGGDFARVSSVQSDYLMGTLRGYSWTWSLDGGQSAPDDHSRLIRPWPKGEQ